MDSRTPSKRAKTAMRVKVERTVDDGAREGAGAERIAAVQAVRVDGRRRKLEAPAPMDKKPCARGGAHGLDTDGCAAVPVIRAGVEWGRARRFMLQPSPV